jgi:hypothetical protein
VNRAENETLVFQPARRRPAVWLQRLVGIAVSLALSACAVPAGSVEEPSQAQLKSAPEAVEVGGHTLRLETYLWRDFMPISPPDGRPLSAVLRVLAADGRPLPPDLRADRLWVLKGGEVWTTALGAPRPEDASRPDRREYVARGGPKWMPGERVDVVVRLQDGTGAMHLLRAVDQRIERTS